MVRRGRFSLAVLAASVVLAAIAAPSWADTITTADRSWTGAKIQWIQDGLVRFTAANRAQEAVPVLKVDLLQVDLREDLNRAEQLRRQGKVAEAIEAYEAALRQESRPDLGGFIRYRLMGLYDRTGQLDRAVEMYLDLVRQPDFHAVVKDWRPQNVGQTKPKVRAAAVAALAEGLRQIRTGLASEYVRQLREHIEAKANEPAGQSEATTSTGPAAGESGRDPAMNLAGRARPWLDGGQYGKVLDLAGEVLAQAQPPREMLEDALLLRGAALWYRAKDRQTLLQSGWALARLLVEFPGSRHVPECQYYLGLVHQRLGLNDQARQLLDLARQAPVATDGVRQRAQKAYLDLVVEPRR